MDSPLLSATMAGMDEITAAVQTMDLLADTASDELRIGSGSRATTKGDGSPVTEVDLRLNKLVISTVLRRHPGCGVVGEEESLEGDGRAVFIVDPVDGTAALTAGLGVACFVMAYVVDGVTEATVIEDPFTLSRFVAIRGKGATLNGSRLELGETPRSNIVSVEALRDSSMDEEWLQRALRAAKANPVHYLAFVNVAARVGTGALAGAIFGRATPWDCLGVALLVKEAGGTVTTLHGEPVDGTTNAEGIILAHPTWHQRLIDAVAASEGRAAGEGHVLVTSPGWTTKQVCSCGEQFSSKAEFWKHQASALALPISTAATGLTRRWDEDEDGISWLGYFDGETLVYQSDLCVEFVTLYEGTEVESAGWYATSAVVGVGGLFGPRFATAGEAKKMVEILEDTLNAFGTLTSRGGNDKESLQKTLARRSQGAELVRELLLATAGAERVRTGHLDE
jgi:fructose-1,6-bisphosphatase/inositol monophosphatase family enzyme